VLYDAFDDLVPEEVRRRPKLMASVGSSVADVLDGIAARHTYLPLWRTLFGVDRASPERVRELGAYGRYRKYFTRGGDGETVLPDWRSVTRPGSRLQVLLGHENPLTVPLR